MSKPKLAISNSGGRTSALMTKLCLEQFSDSHEIIVTFANTGLEHPSTLDFIHKCDTILGFPTVWLEAVVGGHRVGIRHKVVTYETAARNGEPFEAYIKKYGIPNRELPQCTSRWCKDIRDAIGIELVDEFSEASILYRTIIVDSQSTAVIFASTNEDQAIANRALWTPQAPAICRRRRGAYQAVR